MLLEIVTAELIAQANECPTAERFHAIAIAELGRLAPCDSAIFLPRSAAEPPTTMNKVARYYRQFRVGEPRYGRDLAKAHAVGDRDGGYLDTEVYSVSERQRLSFFDEIIRPQGISSRVVAHLSFRGRVAATAHLCRHGRSKGFEHAELELVQRLVPILGLACAAVDGRRESAASGAGELEDLDERERRIVHYLRGGYRNKEIAALLQISPHTVRNQLARIFKKVGVSSRAGLAARAERARG